MRLAPIRKSQFRTLLKSLGFAEDVSRDHIVLTFFVRGTQIARTKVSHGGSGEIGSGLLSLILSEQIYMDREHWTALVAGKLTSGDYVKHLRSKGLIPASKEAKPRGRASHRTPARRR